MHQGVVKFWKQAEGYGFIVPNEGGPDVFVHQSAVEMKGYRHLVPGEPVEYDVIADGVNEDGGPRLKALRVSEVAGRLRILRWGVPLQLKRCHHRSSAPVGMS